MARIAAWMAALVMALTCTLPARADYESGQRAYDAGRLDEALAEWLAAADADDRQAMLALGRLYLEGLGAPQNYLESHKWFNLAASRGLAEAAEERSALAARMTTQQIAAAQERAAAWRPGTAAAAADAVISGIRRAAPAAAATAAPGAHRAGDVFKDCDECPEMVVVPEGSFMMGSPAGEAHRADDEGPQHRVTIARAFAVGVCEITFEEWEECVEGGGCGGYLPNDWGTGEAPRPVVSVSWNDARRYAQWLSNKTGARYRLPSESEWEYAARGGTAGPFHTGSTISTSQANYNGEYAYGSGRKGLYRKGTVRVMSFPANGFGLFDVHGNVWEWVGDCWNADYAGAPADGGAWESGHCDRRVLRGGSWVNAPWLLRSAARNRNAADARYYDFGFRVVRELAP